MKDNYIIKQTGENTWVITNENGEFVNTITKDIVIDYCKNELDYNRTECLSADEMNDGVWWCMYDEYNLELIDNYCSDWEKFIAWFDYICAEYLAKEIVALYKRRLLNCE